MPTTYVALLRGINVGGKNKLPMKDLGEMFVEAGCRQVRTYIQSGNVIFAADPDLVPALPSSIMAQIAQRFGYRIPVILRTSAEIDTVLRRNPFIEAGAAEDTLHVLFLAGEPSALHVEHLDPDRSPPDTFTVRGQEIYLQLPNGAGRTKLTNDYFDTKLATISTGRNWRTVTKLFELMESRGSPTG
jgi:uncharacterized protein (DUF1697 family)